MDRACRLSFDGKDRRMVPRVPKRRRGALIASAHSAKVDAAPAPGLALMTLTLVIANKAYSSWSFRPFILLRHFGIGFAEITIPLGETATREQILRYGPAGKCPALIAGDLTIWDSLSIIEYLAETYPDLSIWPRDKAARAMARSLSAEMHSG